MSSPHRRLVVAASSTRACHRSGIADASASACSGVATGRSPLFSALDAARVAPYQFVVDGRVQHRPQVPVALGDRRFTDAGLEQISTPGQHPRGGEVDQVGGTERRLDVKPKQILVQRGCPGSETGSLGDPPRGVLPHRDAAGVGVDPVPADDLGLGHGQPDIGVRRRGERVRCQTLQAIRTLVASLPPTRGQLPNSSEPATPPLLVRSGRPRPPRRAIGSTVPEAIMSSIASSGMRNQNMTRHIVALVFRCRSVWWELEENDEVNAFRWADPREVGSLMTEAYAARILDGLLRRGRTHRPGP
jgi:hypothetical protein